MAVGVARDRRRAPPHDVDDGIENRRGGRGTCRRSCFSRGLRFRISSYPGACGQRCMRRPCRWHGSLSWLRTTGGTTVRQSLSVRWVFLQTTARMLFAHPAFGVGIGQYSSASAHFAPPALFKLWRPENAHNNLAQIAGELGLIGLITFRDCAGRIVQQLDPTAAAMQLLCADL